MIPVHWVETANEYVLCRLERHATQLYTITYRSSDPKEVGKAQTAATRTKPTLNELRKAAATILDVNIQRRYVIGRNLTGVATYECDEHGYITEFLNFFDPKGNEASGEQLEAFILAHIHVFEKTPSA